MPAASKPGHEHHAEDRAADARRLHQQERADHRRAEERADRSEAAGAADHRDRLAGASRLTSRTVKTPRPLPIAISGASGPSTTPSQSVANDARTIPGSSIG